MADYKRKLTEDTQDSRIRPLYAKACVVSEYIERMLEYMENIVPDRIKLNQLEQEALVFWIFSPYIGISKWEKRKFYLLQVLEQFLQMQMCDDEEEENPEWKLCEIEGVIFY